LEPCSILASYPIYLNDILEEDTQFECK
jgi:hypothetical protein